MKYIIFRLLLIFAALPVLAQSGVKGKVIDAITTQALPDVQVSIEGTNAGVETDANGMFLLTDKLEFGEQVLIIRKQGYLLRRLPVVLTQGQILDLETITLDVDVTAEQATIGLISLTDNEIAGNDDDASSYNVSGLLSAGRDVFLSAAAFDFSATFFRPRGLDNANSKLLINGIEMNKQFNGRPQWGNWGGLNDVQRNREFAMGLSPNDYNFGGVAGTTNIIMRASQERQGGRISYASANRSYTGRVMASYSSGLMANGWAYTVLGSRRFGDEGYIDGTLYDANSFSASVEKRFSDKHSLNLTAFYTPNRRGRATAITEEVFDLKGRKYNPFWGNQNGEIRNSRIREIEEPVIMLNHYWDISEKTRINTNLGYQFGTIKSSRIDNGRFRNPSPEYYQNLPSYFLRFENPSAVDYENAYVAEQQFINDGQLDWEAIYRRNINAATAELANIILQDDVIEDQQLSANVIISSQLNDNITLNGNVSYRGLNSENYAQVRDLLGAQGFLDIDNFSVQESQDGAEGSLPQSDLQNPNRVVREGDRYKYNYEIDADVVSGFAQAVFKYNKVDFHLSGNVSQTTYQRIGLYENGNFPGAASLGPSEQLDFTNYGLKGGFTYKVTGRHILDVNGGYYTVAPGIRNSFSNARQNNDVVTGLESEQIQSIDASYIYRSPLVKARLTGYYTGFSQGTDIGFYFVEDLATLGSENGSAFVQEVITNIERRNVGMELGLEAQVTPTLKLKAAAAVGQNIFTNNPDLYLTSDDFEGELRFGDGTTNLENLHVAAGPERAYQIGFEYRDPNFWWVGATANYFSNAYIDVSNLARSANFALDADGLPFNDYDPEVAAGLLKQEQFDDYMLVNIIGGKSWKINDYFVGFFATINNVLNQEYRTGGFEQSRNANFRNLREDQNRENGPVFGPRYFFGNGTTYYVNAYIRF